MTAIKRVSAVAVPVFALAIGLGSGSWTSGFHREVAPQPTIPAEILSSPAGPYSAQPNLSVDPSGNIYLVWIERAPGTPTALKVSKFDGTRWSTPSVITSGRGIVASAADLPSVFPLPGGRLAAHWLQVSATNSRSYGVRVAQSADGGVTWSTGEVPHPSHETGENGFVSLFAAGGDSTGVIWLDGRNFSPNAGAARNQTMLLAARFSPSGAVAGETILDNRVCDCCQTAFAVSNRGPLLVYRDRSEDEIRDISITSFRDGRWSAPRTVHRDGWNIRSCPVNGPAIATSGSRVAVAWFTAARDTTRVLLSLSSDGGDSFRAPVRIDAGDPLGRVAVAFTDSSTAWVSWLERNDTYNSQLRLKRVSANGATSDAYSLGAPNLTHTTGFPQMVHSRGNLFMAWSVAAEAGAPPAVRVARVRPVAR